MSELPRGMTVRRDAGLYGYERALRRHGWDPIAGVDEAGRGACAGPLVAAAVILPPGDRGLVPGLNDSKLLTERARERCYAQVVRRALSWSVVVIEPEECDRLGMHVANVEALRRALARHGPCEIHRRCFINVRRVDGEDPDLEPGLEPGRELEPGPELTYEEA